MLSRWLLVTSVLCVALQTQEAPGQAESVLEKRLDLDDTRWFFSAWGQKPLMPDQITAPNAGTLVSEYVSEFVTEQQFKVLTEAYNKRVKRHLELREKMYPFDVLERQARMVRRGQTQEQARMALPLPRGFVDPTPDECKTALLIYTREQDKAEEEWASVVEEVLTPEQFAKFIRYFIYHGKAYLHHPLFQSYLGYDAAQKREIQKQLDLYVSETRRVKNAGGDLLTDQNVIRPYYKAFAVLTPEQFAKLAPIVGMKKATDTWSDVRGRIKKAGGPVEQNLGPLVDSIIAEASKQK